MFTLPTRPSPYPGSTSTSTTYNMASTPDNSYNSDEGVSNWDQETYSDRYLGPEETRDREDTSEWPVTILTAGPPALTTNVIIHTPLLPEYPATSMAGTTYCVLVDNPLATQKETLDEALSIQYSRQSKGPGKHTISPFLKGSATRYRYECTGVKCCRLLDNELRTLTHNRVTASTWATMRDIRSSLSRTEPDYQRRDTISFYRAIKNRFDLGAACINGGPECAPVIRRLPSQTITGHDQWVISCSASTPWTNPHDKHFFRPVAEKYSSEYLRELFLNGLPAETDIIERCGVIERNASRLPACDSNHPLPTPFDQLSCEVQFHIIIPDNLLATPYFLFTSIGVHTHPPSPPSTPPKKLAQEIVSLIQRMNDPGLTVARFLRSPYIDELCKKHKVVNFHQIHTSLNNMDRLRRWIYKEQLTTYPQGQDLAGVDFEWKQRHQDPDTAFIQHISTDIFGSIVFYFSQAQAYLLTRQETFQIDLSFKRLARGFNELMVAYWDEEHRKVITLARMAVSSDKRRVYEQCFLNLFRISSGLTQHEFKWKYLHGDGIIGLTVDMDGKQMSGLGRYLVLLDPESRPWQWQLQNVIRFCEVHFLRSIEKATKGILRTSYSVHNRMEALLTCKDYMEWTELCNLLIDNETPTIGNWALHKRNPVIAAGLNRNCSLILQEDWDKLSRTSNAVEQSAYKSYSYGTNLPLLTAIQMAQRLDSRDVEQYTAQEEYGMRHRERSSNLATRYNAQLAKEKRQNIQKRALPAVDMDDDESLLFQASSSGFVRPSYTPRARRSVSRNSSRARSSSPATQSIVLQPEERTSSSFKRKAINNNYDLQNKRLELENRAKEAEIRRLELLNEQAELELIKKRQELGI